MEIYQFDHVVTHENTIQQLLLEMPIHKYLIEEYKESQPFTGKSIAVAHVLVPNTIPMILLLMYGGAQITVTNCCPPTLDNYVLNFLKLIDCKVDLDLTSAKEFDYAIDCGGFFANYPPKHGIVEVTRSGIHKYKSKMRDSLNPQMTLISADDSTCKLIETFIGNPEAVLRGIKKFVNPDINTYLKNKKIAIMGFGKIGRGLARLFRKFSDVVVFEINSEAVQKAKSLGIETFQVKNNVEDNTQALKKCDILISATGFPNVITTHFTKSELNLDLMLNIGAVDEFGNDYTKEEVFMSKDRPFNFNLNPPTGNMYIDPILAAHVDGLRYLIENNLLAGFHNLPEPVDKRILKLFRDYNNVDISDINVYFDKSISLK